MSIGSIFLGLALLIVVVLILTRPFWDKVRDGDEHLSEEELLLIQKQGILEQIRALDFDHDTGKLPDEAYEMQRGALMAEAAEVLQELDALDAGPSVETTPIAPTIDDDIETAVAQLRQSHHTAPANGRTQFCPQCGKRLDADDKFCAGCGQKLTKTTMKTR